MGCWILVLLVATTISPFLILPQLCIAGIQSTGKVELGFQGSQMNWIDKSGKFLVSNDSVYSFGFQSTKEDPSKFVLSVVHRSSSLVIWTANRGRPVSNSDKFIFGDDGNLVLQKGSVTVWTTNTGGEGVSSLELRNSGNLVAVGKNSESVWQSFDHPTNVLVTGQEFKPGMKLVSDISPNNLTYSLEMKSGDLILSADFATPQPYWSMQQDTRKTINSEGDQAIIASINANSWRFYDANKVLLWQFIFSANSDQNTSWAAVLGVNGLIMFYSLADGEISSGASLIQIPSDLCSSPETCGPYSECGEGIMKCQCPSVLSSAHSNCQPTQVANFCSKSNDSSSLMSLGVGLSYFSLGFVSPSLQTDLIGCKASCQNNCSCRLLFFQNGTKNCFLFEDVGSFRSSNSSGFSAFIKLLSGGSNEPTMKGDHSKHFPFVVIIVVATVFVICGLVFAAFWYYRRKNIILESPHDSSEEDNFSDRLAGTPVRFTYQELATATKNFSVKLGQGGFGSVYQGILQDGTRIAVKKLEGVGQGKKEFRAEVTIIGSIHHHHLVSLKGFCAEGTHRLLAYELMSKGSLDRWIFKNKEEFALDWNSRFKIALGTAKGLAYLHEECNARIIHCDIKPENVLLDDNLVAKISDFGLAKLMTREQSHVFTTLRGTRGYLAPEWLTNYAISEKSDVYSYGMLLLEIIGGRKNYDPSFISEKSHFPSYAFKMMEEGNVRELLDSKLELQEDDESVLNAVKVALWCIQEDTNLRPSMGRVVKMLEGICPVPHPPTSSPLGTRIFSTFSKSISSLGTSSGPSGSEINSDAYLSAVRLSGPR